MPLEHEQSYLPVVQTPLVNQDTEYSHGHHDLEHGSPDESPALKPTDSTESDTETPKFRRFTQATNIELFYDLFFVANLTSFTYVHEINDSDTLKQYVGFFCIIWFTWYQVSLYDVRFSMDSLFERSCKAVQFLVMIGFAVVGAKFNPGEEVSGDDDHVIPNFAYFKGLTLILMISRLTLVAEYLQALYFAKAYKKVVVPMLLIAATYFLAAMVYLGLFWTYDIKFGENHSYITWYVIAVLETLLATTVSIIWRNLSFVNTHLVERMSLLTLIILGEGAIGTAKACQYIVHSEGIFTIYGSSAAYIACAVFNLYFMYMIYFDWLHEELFGTIRQQIWSFLHFPLHLAMVLAVEGMSQCITWNAAAVKVKSFEKVVHHWVAVSNNDNTTSSIFGALADGVLGNATELIEQQLSTSSSWTSTLQGVGYLNQANTTVVDAIRNGADSDKARVTAGNAVLWISGKLFSTIFKLAAFYPPETNTAIAEASDYLINPIDFSKYDRQYWIDNFNASVATATQVFGLSFTYFFVTIGLFVVLCTLLAAINRGRKTRIFWVRLIFIAIIGTGLTLLSTLVTDDTVVDNFALSPWMLPTVTLCLFTIVVINSVKFAKPRRWQKPHNEKDRPRE